MNSNSVRVKLNFVCDLMPQINICPLHRTEVILLQNSARDRKAVFWFKKLAITEASNDIVVICEAQKKDTSRWIRMRTDHCYSVQDWTGSWDPVDRYIKEMRKEYLPIVQTGVGSSNWNIHKVETMSPMWILCFSRSHWLRD